MENEEKLKQIIARVFKVSEGSITDNSSPDTIIKWDSLQHLVLVVSLEQYFKISFKFDEIVEMVSVGAIKVVLRKRGTDI